MSIEKFLTNNNFTKENWKTITNSFQVSEDVSHKQEYMGKDFFVAKKDDLDFIPTVYSSEKETGVLYEHEVIDFLNSNGINAAKPLPAIDGENFLKINGKIICFYEKIEGEHYNNSDEELLEIARTMGRMHSIGKNFKEKKEHWFFRGKFELRPFTLNSKEKIIQEAIKKVKEKNIDWGNLDSSLVHGDLHPGNVIFNNGKVAGVFDFETANIDSTVEDLSWVLRTFTSSKGWKKSGEFDLSRVEIAKEEYLKYYKTDLELIPELMLAHYLNYINYKIEKKDDLTETLIQVKWILDNY